MLQNAFFVEIARTGVVTGKGQVVGQVGKTGEHFMLAYHSKPPFRRVRHVSALENLALFDKIEDAEEFLALNTRPRAANDDGPANKQPSRPEAQPAAVSLATPPSQEGCGPATDAPPAEAKSNVRALRPDTHELPAKN